MLTKLNSRHVKHLACFVYLSTFLISLSTQQQQAQQQQQQYLYHDELTQRLELLARNYVNKSHLYSIGKSVEGRDLWVLAVAASDAHKHVLLRPEVKLVGNIHGNELSTGETLLRFVEHLLTNPENDRRVSEILANSRVHVLVSMNPDGTEIAARESCTSKIGRNNSNKIDLNRNFPDAFFCNRAHLEPETVAVLEWMDSTRFLLSASFHTGASVVSYGFENWPGAEFATAPIYVPTDYDDSLRYLAKIYSMNHKTMRATICDNETFVDGITNGANWWPPVRGGMQDINYWRYGTYEITMEIGCCLTPPASELTKIWLDNKNALIEFAHAAQTGIRGLVKYQNGQPARYLSVQFDKREPMFKTSETGEYFALLLPGTYNMTILFNCEPVFASIVHVHHTTGLLVFNVTLDDRLYFRAFYHRLDRYALFCSPAKAPIDCRDPARLPASPTTPTFVVRPQFNSATAVTSGPWSFVVVFLIFVGLFESVFYVL